MKTVMPSFCHWQVDTLALNILWRPRANKTAIGKVIGKQLEIHVAEYPVRGRATAHMVDFWRKISDPQERDSGGIRGAQRQQAVAHQPTQAAPFRYSTPGA